MTKASASERVHVHHACQPCSSQQTSPAFACIMHMPAATCYSYASLFCAPHANTAAGKLDQRRQSRDGSAEVTLLTLCVARVQRTGRQQRVHRPQIIHTHTHRNSADVSRSFIEGRRAEGGLR
eukprot:3487436-Rhodomonas_salina.1